MRDAITKEVGHQLTPQGGGKTYTAIMCSSPAVTRSSAFLWWLRHPRAAERPQRLLASVASTLGVLCYAPRAEIRLSSEVAGRMIFGFLSERRIGIRRRHYARSVLIIPAGEQPLFSGRSMQAARTNMTRARFEGWTCAEVSVDDAKPGEHIFHLFDAFGGQAGRLHVTIDRHCALIHILGSRVAFGFYLIHGHLVTELQRRGVRYLMIDSGMAVSLKPGLLYMQARLGYQVLNIRPVLQLAHQP